MSMTYEEFCDNVKEDIADYLVEYDVQSITINEIKKEGGLELKGLVIHEKDVTISPTIYLESFYSKYTSDSITYEEALAGVAAFYNEHRNPSLDFDISKFKDFEQMKDLIVPVLINTETNKDYIENLPHKTYEDLSIIYKVKLCSTEDSEATVKITNQLLGCWGIKLDELASIAESNIKKNDPPTITSMFDMMKEMMGEDFPEEMYPEEAIDEMNQIIVTSLSKQHGSFYMLDSNVMDQVADKLQSDVIVLPSSIHECICCTMDTNSLEKFKEMVGEVNDTQVAPEDRLSYSVYCYDAVSHKLMTAENYVMNKSQDLSNKVTL